MELEDVDSRLHALQDTWLLTLLTVLLATAVPWFVSSFNIDFGALSWSLLGLGLIYAASTFIGNAALSTAAKRRALIMLHAAGTVCLGFVWLRSGGLQNPVFLLAFLLPVIGAGALSRWQPYMTAILAVLVTAVVALEQAPELRWYAGGLREFGQRLLSPFVPAGTGADSASALPGFYAPVTYDVVLLEVFSILIFSVAVAAESIGNSIERLLSRLRTAESAATQAQKMWSTLVQEMPLPTLLVDTDTMQIILCSKHLLPFSYEPLTGRALFEAIHFSYPERLQDALRHEGGVVESVAILGTERALIANVRMRSIHFEGRRLAIILLEESSIAFSMAAALDAEDHAAMVISASGHLAAANKATRALFPEVRVGSNITEALANIGGTTKWWEPGLTGRRRLHLTIHRRSYLVTCTTAALPGEEEALYVLAFSPLLMSAVAVENSASAGR
jgi:hypothetical protein